MLFCDFDFQGVELLATVQSLSRSFSDNMKLVFSCVGLHAVVLTCCSAVPPLPREEDKKTRLGLAVYAPPCAAVPPLPREEDKKASFGSFSVVVACGSVTSLQEVQLQ